MKEIAKLKEDSEAKQREFVETTAQVKKMQMNIGQYKERILMMNEEMEQYIFNWEREKNDHFNTAQALNALENRYYKENEEKENKEKEAKEKEDKAKKETENKEKEESTEKKETESKEKEKKENTDNKNKEEAKS